MSRFAITASTRKQNMPSLNRNHDCFSFVCHECGYRYGMDMNILSGTSLCEGNGI